MSEELRRGIPKGIITGEREITPKERKEARLFLEKKLKKIGVLKENEKLDDIEEE